MHYRLNTSSSETKGSVGLWIRRLPRSPGRVAPGHAKAAHFARNRRIQFVPRLSGDAEAIESQVQSLSADQLLERYHELADQRLGGGIGYIESFELDRIEARLDAESEDERGRLKMLQDDWQRERDALVASIESLLTRLRAAR